MDEILAKIAAGQRLTFAEWVVVHDAVMEARGDEWEPEPEPVVVSEGTDVMTAQGTVSPPPEVEV